MENSYCVHCRKRTGNNGTQVIELQTNRGVRSQVKSTCSVCGGKKSSFIKGSGCGCQGGKGLIKYGVKPVRSYIQPEYKTGLYVPPVVTM